MGWPILGDNIYGTAPREGGPGLHLHAREGGGADPGNKPPVTVTAPVPRAYAGAASRLLRLGEALRGYDAIRRP